jgi:hypothetical protein
MGSDDLGGLPSSLHLVELVKARRGHCPDIRALNCVFPSHLSAPEAVRYRHVQHAHGALGTTLAKETEKGATGLAITEREAC